MTMTKLILSFASFGAFFAPRRREAAGRDSRV